MVLVKVVVQKVHGKKVQNKKAKKGKKVQNKKAKTNAKSLLCKYDRSWFYYRRTLAFGGES
jgi:hypothetical protein